MMGRLGCTFAALLKMVLALETVEEGIAVFMVLLLRLFCFVSVIEQF